MSHTPKTTNKKIRIEFIFNRNAYNNKFLFCQPGFYHFYALFVRIVCLFISFHLFHFFFHSYTVLCLRLEALAWRARVNERPKIFRLASVEFTIPLQLVDAVRRERLWFYVPIFVFCCCFFVV